MGEVGFQKSGSKIDVVPKLNFWTKISLFRTVRCPVWLSRMIISEVCNEKRIVVRNLQNLDFIISNRANHRKGRKET